jgi:dextranase
VTELLPTKATFAPGENVEVELRGAAGPTAVSLWQLERKLAEVVTDDVARFGPLAEGGYGVEANGAHTALDVLADPMERFRYGFVSDFAPGRDPAGVADNIRRLHLNGVQFYDWMYRHAELLPPQDEFEDAMGRPVSLGTVRALAAAVRGAGSLPLGYAAVYAVGAEHWPAWQDEGLYRADGTPWMLGDFLWNVDPASERWLRHFTAELAAAADQVGFAGFHLDQYGAPKRARRLDGRHVDLAEAFPKLIERVDAALPEARHVFNNVNDFPTWSTAGAPQDAVYIEVWPPHDRLDHLGGLVAKARGLAPRKSVSLAAYLSAYAADPAGALPAMKLELATVFSHGGTCLLHGEEDAILTEAYYVRHHRMDGAAAQAARLYYDFAVRYGDLLFDRESVDVTRSYLGGVNEELRVEAAAPVATDCVPGALWTRLISGAHGLVVSLIDLTGQDDVTWDAPKRAATPIAGVTVALERAGPVAPRFHFASPDAPTAQKLASKTDGRYDVVEVPAFSTWALVWATDA